MGGPVARQESLMARIIRRRVRLPFADRKPSEVTNWPWVYAQRKVGDSPAATERCGKWLIFVPVAEVDAVWERIKTATEAGLLGDASKVATAMPNPRAADPKKRVIRVYTYDADEVADVRRVRDQLRLLGFVRAPRVQDGRGHVGRQVLRDRRRAGREVL
jgi:hypothetical protein